MANPDAAAALNAFTGCCGHFQVQPIARVGFSGSSIWKVAAADPISQREFPGPLCLKRWPADHPPPARLPWIHQVLKQARSSGLEFVPEIILTQQGGTTCEFAGSTWELMTWLPGEVDRRHPTPERRIAAAFFALAQFHAAVRVRDIFSQDDSASPAPAFADRWTRWQELQSGHFDLIRSAVHQRRIPLVDDLAQRWIYERSDLSYETTSNLKTASLLQLPMQPAIRDLWRDHVLFTGDAVTGFIDYGAMRIDTPLTDLARLLGSLAGDDPALRERAFTAYSALQPLSPREIELIDLLDHSGTLIAGWNWLDWLYVQQRQFPSLTAVRDRLSELLSRRKPVIP